MRTAELVSLEKGGGGWGWWVRVWYCGRGTGGLSAQLGFILPKYETKDIILSFLIVTFKS